MTPLDNGDMIHTAPTGEQPEKQPGPAPATGPRTPFAPFFEHENVSFGYPRGNHGKARGK